MNYEVAIIRWLDASEDAECPSPSRVRGPVQRTNIGWVVKDSASVLHLLTERSDWTGGKTEYNVFVIPRALLLELCRTGVRTDPTARAVPGSSASTDGSARRKHAVAGAGGSTTSHTRAKRSSAGRGAR